MSNESLEDRLDDIDASIFSGTALESLDNRKALKEYCIRWLRAVRDHEAEPQCAAPDVEFLDQYYSEGINNE